MLARFRSPNQGTRHQTALVKRHFALACVGFHVVKFAFEIAALVDRGSLSTQDSGLFG